MGGGGGWGPEGPAHCPQGGRRRHQVLTSLHPFVVVPVVIVVLV